MFYNNKMKIFKNKNKQQSQNIVYKMFTKQT